MFLLGEMLNSHIIQIKNRTINIQNEEFTTIIFSLAPIREFVSAQMLPGFGSYHISPAFALKNYTKDFPLDS